jgi:hypothetical protein
MVFESFSSEADSGSQEFLFVLVTNFGNDIMFALK